MVNALSGVDVESLSDDELRQLRRMATEELRRRGVLPPREERRPGAGKARRRSMGDVAE